MQRIVFLVGMTVWLLSLATGCKSSQSATASRAAEDSRSEQVKAADRQRAESRYIDATTLMIRGDYPAAEEAFLAVIEAMPSNHAAQYNLSKLALEANRTEAAVTYGRAALAADPSNYWYYVQLRRSLELRGEYDQAIEVQRRLIDRFADHPEARLHLTDLYLRNNRPKLAIEALKELEARVGVSEETGARRYDIRRNLGQHEEALAVAQELVELFPEEPAYSQMVYRELQSLGREAEGVSLLKNLLEQDPLNGFALLSLADYYKNQDQIDLSDQYLFRAFENPEIDPAGKLQIIDNLMTFTSEPGVLPRAKQLTAIFIDVHPEDAGGYYAQGHVFLVEGKLDSARVYLRQGLDREPANLQGWVELIQLSYVQQQFDQMYDDADEAMGYFPNQDQILFFYGVASANQGQYRQAVSALEKIIRIGSAPKPLITQTHTELGRVYHEQEEYDKSDRSFEAALQPDPDNAPVLNNYAYYLSLRGEKLDQAQQMIERALKSAPKEASYLDTYGWVLYQQGKYEQAERALRKALDQGSTSAEIYEHHGDVLFKLGRREEAIQAWNKAKTAGSTLNVQEKLAQ
jgi:tetratricopeptide (TPR) repeat protein